MAEKRQGLWWAVSNTRTGHRGFIVILEGSLRAERFLELSVIGIASILVEQREQPGITE